MNRDMLNKILLHRSDDKKIDPKELCKGTVN